MAKFFAVLIAALLLVSCAQEEKPSAGSATNVVGVITSVDGNAADIDGFTVESESDGGEVEILIKPDYDYGFDLTHLYEHRDQEEPVDVTVESKDGELYATSIDDV